MARRMAKMSDIGEQLRRARLAAGLTQRELAERAGLSHQVVQKIEKGQNTTMETLDVLATAAGAELIVRMDGPREIRRRLPKPDRLAIAGRLLLVLPRLSDAAVDALLEDIALWETEHPPQLP